MTRSALTWVGAIGWGLLCAAAASGQGPNITPPTLPNGDVGVMYNQTLDAHDVLLTCCKWTVDSGALPDGLTLSTGAGTATISGTPATPGTYNFTIKAD